MSTLTLEQNQRMILKALPVVLQISLEPRIYASCIDAAGQQDTCNNLQWSCIVGLQDGLVFWKSSIVALTCVSLLAQVLGDLKVGKVQAWVYWQVGKVHNSNTECS